MDICDWYSGTDETGKVSSTIQVVMGRMDQQIAGFEDVTKLRGCLGIEGDTNWRGYLFGLTGLVLLRSGDANLAKDSFLSAMEAFDFTVGNFDAVSNVHCQCCYSLGTLSFDAGEAGAALGYFTRCLPKMHNVYDELFIGNIFLFMDLCMNAREDYPAAVAFSENAVIATGGDVDALESLMISQYNSGCLDDATRTYRRILEKCDTRDTLARVRDFAVRNLGGD